MRDQSNEVIRLLAELNETENALQRMMRAAKRDDWKSYRLHNQSAADALKRVSCAQRSVALQIAGNK